MAGVGLKLATELEFRSLEVGSGGGEGPTGQVGPWAGGQGRHPRGLGKVEEAAARHSPWEATALELVGVKGSPGSHTRLGQQSSPTG